MVPHNGAEKFKTIPRNYDRAGGEIGERADIGIAMVF